VRTAREEAEPRGGAQVLAGERVAAAHLIGDVRRPSLALGGSRTTRGE
jgi:hypothetical protein